MLGDGMAALGTETFCKSRHTKLKSKSVSIFRMGWAWSFVQTAGYTSSLSTLFRDEQWLRRPLESECICSE
jgi:hypothetical protein